MTFFTKTRYLALTTLFLLLTSTVIKANEVDSSQYKADWKSPEAIIHAMYQTISAGPGEQRNWQRFRELFFDNAEMLISMQSSQFSGIIASDIDTIITQTDAAYGKTGFHEIELEQKVIKYGAMASVYSSFAVKLKANDTKALMKGLNHFQLLFDGDRWWIISNTSIIDNKNYKGSKALPSDV
jgi:hypothetical protein